MKTIISASRRTDIPSFYYDWLQESLKNEKVSINNPMYPEKNYTVDLTPEEISAIVLWSKNFKNVLNNPGYLENYNLYFQYTITGYSKILEPNVPTYEESLKTLEGLLTKYNPKQFNIRFDPIIISTEGEIYPTPNNPMQARLNMFEKLCKDLKILGMDDCRITTSFLSIYGDTIKNLESNGIVFLERLNLLERNRRDFAKKMNEIALKYNREIYTCADNGLLEIAKTYSLNQFKQGHCIDGEILNELFPEKFTKSKDPSQRLACGCIKSRDIGGYFPCKHNCAYCYANPTKKE